MEAVSNPATDSTETYDCFDDGDLEIIDTEANNDSFISSKAAKDFFVSGSPPKQLRYNAMRCPMYVARIPSDLSFSPDVFSPEIVAVAPVLAPVYWRNLYTTSFKNAKTKTPSPNNRRRIRRWTRRRPRLAHMGLGRQTQSFRLSPPRRL